MVLLDELALHVADTWKKLSTELSSVVVQVALPLVGARSPTVASPAPSTMPEDVMVALPLPIPAAVKTRLSQNSQTALLAPLVVVMAALAPITVPSGGARL